MEKTCGTAKTGPLLQKMMSQRKPYHHLLQMLTEPNQKLNTPFHQFHHNQDSIIGGKLVALRIEIVPDDQRS